MYALRTFLRSTVFETELVGIKGVKDELWCSPGKGEWRIRKGKSGRGTFRENMKMSEREGRARDTVKSASAAVFDG